MDYEYSNLPLGLAMANLLDDDIETERRPLTEAQKEEMLFRQKDAEERERKEQIKNASPEDGWNDIHRFLVSWIIRCNNRQVSKT